MSNAPKTTPAPPPCPEAGLIQALKALAKERGLTHQQISDLTGIQRPHVTGFFAGKTSPRLATVLKICAALGVQITIEK